MNKILYCFRHKVSDGAVELYPSADVRSRNADRGNIDRLCKPRIFRVTLPKVKTGTAHDDQLDPGQDLLRRFPGMELQEVVGTDNQGDRRFRIQRLEGVDGVDGERYSGPLYLDVAELKIWIALDSQLSHPQAVGCRRNRSLLLVWWSCRGDKENGVKPFRIADAFDCYQMSDVGRIEGAAEDADLHRAGFFSRYFLSISLNISRSEEHTSELQSQSNLVCRLLLEKKKKK